MQATLEIAERISSISVSSTMKVAADADRLRREGADVVDFGAGEPDFPTPENIKNAAIDALAKNFTKYTPAGGTQELQPRFGYLLGYKDPRHAQAPTNLAMRVIPSSRAASARA